MRIEPELIPDVRGSFVGSLGEITRAALLITTVAGALVVDVGERSSIQGGY